MKTSFTPDFHSSFELECAYMRRWDSLLNFNELNQSVLNRWISCYEATFYPAKNNIGV